MKTDLGSSSVSATLALAYFVAGAVMVHHHPAAVSAFSVKIPSSSRRTIATSLRTRPTTFNGITLPPQSYSTTTKPIAGIRDHTLLFSGANHDDDTATTSTNNPSSITPDAAAEQEEEEEILLLQRKRNILKRRLLEAADNFKEIQQQAVEQEQANNSSHVPTGEATTKESKTTGRFILRLVRRIVSKILRKRSNKTKKRERTVFRSSAFATAKLEVGESGNAVITLAEELAKLNPTLVPTDGWQQHNEASKLDGKWKLRFTTAADATFQSSPERGRISTSQEIDATKGTLTNVVDFERGNIKGFRVVVAGEATSDNEISLSFRRVVILLRNSRFLKKLVFPIPAKLFRAVNRYLSNKRRRQDKKSTTSRGPYFQIQYLDDDLRIHKTGEENWFIQSRVE